MGRGDGMPGQLVMVGSTPEWLLEKKWRRAWKVTWGQ